MEVSRETKEEVSKKWKREEEKEENDTEIVERRCANHVSTVAFDIFFKERIRRAVVIPGMTLVVCRTVIL